ncbi:uncharacterized protein LOC117118182 [Anneissia japonica]|uniref:uncharacterized protein LOC117118182 n=1 Tax=Anneissia japonica TaxID=1529436 RepID=UPI00142568DC|nr:uncharacterized protein LOC117118182 [Anneissia japonica]
MLKYVVDELDKLKASLEEVRDIVIMKTSRRHMEWAFHSARFGSSIQGMWKPANDNQAECELPKQSYSNRILQTSTFHGLFDDILTSPSLKPNDDNVSDEELSHSTSMHLN